MDQEKHAVADQSEGKEQGGEVLAGEMVGDEGLHCGDPSPEKEDAKEEQNAGHGDAAAEIEEVENEMTFDSDASSAEESGGVVAVGDADDGVAPENEDEEVPKNPLATRFRYRAAIAHPTPPSTYRRLPLRRRKQYKPTRFIAEGTASAAAGSAGVESALSAAVQGSTVAHSESEATVDQPSSDDGESGTDFAIAPAAWEASSSSSHRPPSRSRKQRRPEHFIPDEAEASARSKARRSNIALDRILTSLCVSPERRPECSRNVTADDDDGGQGQGGAEGPEATGGRARVLAVVAVLCASLVLCVVACALFYVVGKRNEHGPSDAN